MRLFIALLGMDDQGRFREFFNKSNTSLIVTLFPTSTERESSLQIQWLLRVRTSVVTKRMGHSTFLDKLKQLYKLIDMDFPTLEVYKLVLIYLFFHCMESSTSSFIAFLLLLDFFAMWILGGYVYAPLLSCIRDHFCG